MQSQVEGLITIIMVTQTQLTHQKEYPVFLKGPILLENTFITLCAHLKEEEEGNPLIIEGVDVELGAGVTLARISANNLESNHYAERPTSHTKLMSLKRCGWGSFRNG